MEPTTPPTQWTRLTLPEIGCTYGRFRLIQPAVDRAIRESVRRHGQLTPVVVGRTADGAFELIDGFKRYRACEQLKIQALLAREVAGGNRVLKAAMVTLNRSRQKIGDLEEALVIHSLHRDDCLPQQEIAALLQRHPSWVSRRIALVERLDEEVLDNLRLGLVSVTMGRELSHLPRGKQAEVLRAILRFRLSTRDARRLICRWQELAEREQAELLRHPDRLLPGRGQTMAAGASVNQLWPDLKALEASLRGVLAWLQGTDPAGLKIEERFQLSHCLVGIRRDLDTAWNVLHPSVNQPAPGEQS